MKVLYNQLHAFQHNEGIAHSHPHDTTQADQWDIVDGVWGGSGQDPGLDGVDYDPDAPDPNALSVHDLPLFPKGEIAGLIPNYNDVNLDYFGLALQAGDYNIQKIEENLARGMDQAGPAANRMTRDNIATYQSTMDTLLPGHQGLIDSSSRRAQQNLDGVLGPEVESAILRSGAHRTIASGIGFGGRSQNLVARDLGLTSLDLQNQGFSQAQQLYKQSADVSAGLMVRPADLAMTLQGQYNAGSLLTPEQAISGQKTNIDSKFSISKLQIQNAKDAYEGEYSRTGDILGKQDADETRKWQAEQAQKDREYGLMGDILGTIGAVFGGGKGNQEKVQTPEAAPNPTYNAPSPAAVGSGEITPTQSTSSLYGGLTRSGSTPVTNTSSKVFGNTPTDYTTQSSGSGWGRNDSWFSNSRNQDPR